MDVFLYNGEIVRGADLKFMNLVAEKKSDDDCLVIMVTPGGNPDAAYKMARYLQSRYATYSVLVPGLCKSAGTLFAIGAHSLVFAPYGELGPLDIQLAKTDNLASMESGLNISEAFRTLESRARETFVGVTLDVIGSSGGVVSFQTASHAATEFVGSLYSPIFNRIDPEEVGSRTRSSRIGTDYGERLNLKWANLKKDALNLLSETYPSHSFVVDSLEAAELFERVRMASPAEMELVTKLKGLARQPQASLTLEYIGTISAPNMEGEGNDEESETNLEDGSEVDGVDSEAAVEAERASAGDTNVLKVRARNAQR